MFSHPFQTKHDVEAHRVTSGATVGRMFFRMAWIQFLRIPEVMADSVNAPSLLWEEDKDTSEESIDQMHDSWTKRDHFCSFLILLFSSTSSATEYTVNPMSFYNFHKTFPVMITGQLWFKKKERKKYSKVIHYFINSSQTNKIFWVKSSALNILDPIKYIKM